jgi:hypothetical protein
MTNSNQLQNHAGFFNEFFFSSKLSLAHRSLVHGIDKFRKVPWIVLRIESDREKRDANE